MAHPSPLTRTILFLASVLLSGCSVAGASSFELFGAFFPARMLCALLGIAGSGAARAVFVGTELSNVIPHQLLVCTGVGVIAATLAWLLSFGR